MGRGTIVANLGEGHYSITLDYGSAEIAERVASYDEEIASYDARIITAQSEAASAAVGSTDLWNAVDGAINTYRASPTAANNEAVIEAADIAATFNAQLAEIDRRLLWLRIDRAGLISRKATFEAVPVTESRDAWCADYTIDATGLVSTIEINGEGPEILIGPSPETPTSADGLMTARMAMSGAATYLNAALLPGWQKFSPTYRLAEITAINRELDTCSVTLDEALSSAQDLDINQELVLLNVPFDYMDCNNAPFLFGDRVVVGFTAQDWDQPKVIGFESNPRPCTEWIWAGAPMERQAGGTLSVGRQYLIAKIHPDTLAVEETWGRPASIYVGPIRRYGVENAYYSELDGRVKDAKTGSVAAIFAEADSSIVWGLSDIAITGTHIFTASAEDEKIYEYTWPDGVLTRSFDWPGAPPYGVNLVADSGTLVLFVRKLTPSVPEPRPKQWETFAYDPDTLALRWSEVESYGSTNYGPYDLDVSEKYVASLFGTLVESVEVYELVVRNVTTGALIRRTPVTQLRGEPGDDPLISKYSNGVAIRGDDVYVTTTHFEVVSGGKAQGYGDKYSIVKFNILTGVMSSPDITTVDIFGALTADRYQEAGLITAA